VLAIPETTTSLIKALAKRFVSNFGNSLALTDAFYVFNIAKTFFFNVVPTDFAYAVDNFFTAGLAFLKSITN
jgi:hypothetical protein